MLMLLFHVSVVHARGSGGGRRLEKRLEEGKGFFAECTVGLFPGAEGKILHFGAESSCALLGRRETGV